MMKRHPLLTFSVLIAGCLLRYCSSAPLPEKESVSKTGCVFERASNDSDIANLTSIMGDIKKSRIELSGNCHNESVSNDGRVSSFAASAIPGLKKKSTKKTINEHESKKKSINKGKSSLSKLNTDANDLTKKMKGSLSEKIIDDKEDEKPKASLTKINTDSTEIEKSQSSLVEEHKKEADKEIDVKGLASVFRDVDASKRNFPARVTTENKTSLHSSVPTLSKPAKVKVAHTAAVKDITPNAASTEEPTIISEDKPLTHNKISNVIVSPKISHNGKNDSSGVQRSTHPSIVPTDESIKSTTANTTSASNSSQPVKGGNKGKVAETVPESKPAAASGTGLALQGSSHAKSPSSKSPAPDPYAEIAEGPDRPTLPELKTNTDAENGPPSKVIKTNHAPEPSIEGEPVEKPMEVPPTANKGGKSSGGVQDVGGLLDRLTDKLNKGENIANEQPNESNNLQEQLSDLQNTAAAKEHQFDKEDPAFNNPEANFENMQTSFDKVSESALGKDASPFEKEPSMYPKQTGADVGNGGFQNKEPGFQKSNNWEDYNSILKSLDEEAKHGPGMNEYSYDEQNQYHPNANSMPSIGNPGGEGGMNFPGENEEREPPSDERVDREGGARAVAQGELGPYASSNSYTAAAVGAMENGASFDRQNVAAMNYLAGNTGPPQAEMGPQVQSSFNGFGAPPGGGYGGAMMKRDYTFYPRYLG